MTHPFDKAKPSILNNQAFLTIVPLGLVVLGIWGAGFYHVAKESAAEAETTLQKKAWTACGKGHGKPCNCVPGACKCGTFKGFTCQNCRPMN